MYAVFNIQYTKSRQSVPRREIFNLKNYDCQQKFFEETSNCEKLRNCFKSSDTLENQSGKFLKSLDDVLHTSFKKIRM